MKLKTRSYWSIVSGFLDFKLESLLLWFLWILINAAALAIDTQVAIFLMAPSSTLLPLGVGKNLILTIILFTGSMGLLFVQGSDSSYILFIHALWVCIIHWAMFPKLSGNAPEEKPAKKPKTEPKE